ncbi:MAG: hypothetical protein QFB87_04310 [Patescibacteria group bacterium]|nr:hypothetical protein [Patescibacteria group bacterium]
MAEKSKPNYPARRAGAVIALGATVFGGIKAVDAVVDYKNSVQHHNQEYKQFSKPNLAKHLVENHISPTQIVVHYVQPGESTPIAVAHNLGAKDTTTVAYEIANQVGGSHSMEVGDAVVVPLDQLNQPAELAQK